jgi:hypothetical protein
VQSAKWAFYRVWPPVGAAPAPHLRSHLPADRRIVIRPTRGQRHIALARDDMRVGDAVFVIQRRNLTIPGAR